MTDEPQPEEPEQPEQAEPDPPKLVEIPVETKPYNPKGSS